MLTSGSLSPSTLDTRRVTTTTYAFFVTPSCAVTVTVMRFGPTTSAHRFVAHTPDAFDTTAAAFPSLRVAVTTTDVTPLATLRDDA